MNHAKANETQNPGKTEQIIAEELERLLESPMFVRSPVLTRLLQFLVEHRLGGGRSSPKAYAIATEALGRSEDFDPAVDSYPRVMVGRLRTLLDRYYADTPWIHRLRVPQGSYEVVVQHRIAPPSRSGDEADAEGDVKTATNANGAGATRSPGVAGHPQAAGPRYGRWVVALVLLALALRRRSDDVGAPSSPAESSEAAALAGCAAGSERNTVLFGGDGAVSGANAEREALLGAIPAAPESGAALVLGAGGLARAAVEARRERGWSVDVAARTPERGAALAAACGGRSVANAAATGLPYGVVVNATPLGLDASDPLPCDAALLSPGVLAVDAPYRPSGTAFSHEAIRRGARLVDGFTLLLSQAVGQSALFTGRQADAATLAAVSYTHLTLPTSDLV